VLFRSNTHRLMNYQIGYGRKFTLLKSKKGGTLTYIPRVDVGIVTGAAQTSFVHASTGEEDSTSVVDKEKFQGTNYSMGHRLEYKRGRVAMFVEQKNNYASLEHRFLDGEAKYKLNYASSTFGVIVDLYTLNKKKKKK